MARIYDEEPRAIQEGRGGPRRSPDRPENPQLGRVSAVGIASLQRLAGNHAVADLVAQRSGPAVLVQRDYFSYGDANTTPHLHRYGVNSHLKILDRGKIRRINLVVNGERKREAVAEAFQLARAFGDAALITALKEAISGIGPFGAPGTA